MSSSTSANLHELPELLYLYQQIEQHIVANNAEPISYYKLIIDPKSYADTSDNALDITFLCERKAICISAGIDGMPHVGFPTTNDDFESNTFANSCILTKFLYKNFIMIYDIKEPMLKRKIENGIELKQIQSIEQNLKLN